MRVEQKSEEKKIEPFVEPQPLGKIMLLMGLAVASSLLFWLAWDNAIISGLTFTFSWENLLIIFSTLLALCLMFTFVAIAEIVINKRLYLFIMAVVSSATLFIFFTPNLWSLIAFVVVMLNLLYWKREIRLDEKTRVSFVPKRIIDSGLKLAVTLVLLAACLNYFNYLITRQDAETQTFNSLTETSSHAVENVLLLYYDDKFSPEMTLNSFLTNISFAVTDKITDKAVEVNTGNEKLNDAMDLAITEGLTVAQQEFVNETRKSFAETFEITVDGSETMSEIINQIVTKNINKFLDPYIKFIPALLAIGLFFLLNIFNFVYRELIKSFSFLLFHILKWMKFIYIRKIQIEAEKVSLEE